MTYIDDLYERLQDPEYAIEYILAAYNDEDSNLEDIYAAVADVKGARNHHYIAIVTVDQYHGLKAGDIVEVNKDCLLTSRDSIMAYYAEIRDVFLASFVDRQDLEIIGRL